MAKTRKYFIFALLLVALLAPSALPNAAAQDTKVLHSAFLPGDLIIDPSLSTWNNEIQVVNQTFPGLTTFDELTVEVQPGIASDWSMSEDGLTYTFNLIPDIPWVRWDADAGEVVQVMDDNGNVRVVTAQDIVYGINRTLDPATGSQYAGTLAPWILNGEAKLAGEDVELGARAVDDFTLELTSPKPASFLPMIYGMWMSRPEPQWAIEEYGDSWTEPGNYHSYGPYALKSWDHDVQITITRNPFWPGTDYIPQPKIDEYNWVYLEDPAMLASYEAGELDWIPIVPLPDLDRLRAQYPDELRIAPDVCTYYYGFNTAIEPTDSAHMRRALSMAIDRDIVTQITGGGEIPAGFFTRPDVAAAPTEELYPDLAIKSDPEAAKAELQAYLDETGYTADSIPSITLMHNTSARHATIAQAIQQMWQETLGLEVQIMSQDAQTFNETLRRDAPAVYRLGWCYDYPDTNSFINDVFRTKGPDSNNHTNWGPDEFYALLDQAAVSSDMDERRELYAQAEYMLVNGDAAIAPIYFYTSQQMTKPNVERSYAVNRIERLEKWDIQ